MGYCRVSTEEQSDSGLGLEAQKAAITAEVTRRGWELVRAREDGDEMFVDVASGKSMKKRAELTAALTEVEAGHADVLVVAKLDRLSRSVPDFAGILARSTKQGWALNICDLGVDTTTPSGKMVAQIMMVLAEWEREMIGDRTKKALVAAVARGQKLGRPKTVTADTVTLIRILREGGKGYHSIANTLNHEGVPTAQGGKCWYPATVRKIYEREHAAANA